MRLVSAVTKLVLPAIGCALALFVSPQLFAQSGIICPEKSFANLVANPAAPTGSAPLFSAVTTAAPGEEAAYKAFSKLKADNTDKRIQVGQAFVQKYPFGPFPEPVYSQLVFAEYQKQDFAKLDEYANKALALNPDDLKVLVLVGWVIPHAADAGSAQLDKAEKYEKHVLELLPAVVKPASMTDQELAATKSQY
jgi:tetratricopeptide (TPR) repeat protein